MSSLRVVIGMELESPVDCGVYGPIQRHAAFELDWTRNGEYPLGRSAPSRASCTLFELKN